MSTKSEIAELLYIVREKAKSCGLVEISKLVVDSSSSIDVVEIYTQHLREIMSDFEKSLEAINLITNFSDLEVVKKAVESVAGVYMEDEHFTAFEELGNKFWPAHIAILKPKLEEKARQCQTIPEIENLYHKFKWDIYEKRWKEIAKERISTCKNWSDISVLYKKDVKKRYTFGKTISVSGRETIGSVVELYRKCFRNFSHEKALADVRKCKTLAQAIKQLLYAKENQFYSEKARVIYTRKYQRLARKIVPAILERCDTSEKVAMVLRLYILNDCPTKIFDICRLKLLQLHMQENF